jgi:hypothetical protein
MSLELSKNARVSSPVDSTLHSYRLRLKLENKSYSRSPNTLITPKNNTWAEKEFNQSLESLLPSPVPKIFKLTKVLLIKLLLFVMKS